MKFLVLSSWRLAILKLLFATELLGSLTVTAVIVNGSMESKLLALAQQLLSPFSSSGTCSTIVFMYPENFVLQDFIESHNNDDSAVVISHSLYTLEKFTLVLNHPFQCSTVIYPQSLRGKTAEAKTWLRHMPGGIVHSFHFVVESRAQALQIFCWHCPFVRRLHNVFVFPTSETNDFGPILTPNRFNGRPDFFHVGKVMENQILLEHLTARKHGAFWNKWADMNGSSIFVGALPTPPSIQLTNSSFKPFNCFAIQLQQTADYLNAALQMKFIPLNRRFGAQLGNGSWDGFIGNRMEDNVLLPCLPS